MTLRTLNTEHLELIRQWRNTPYVRKNMFTSHIISEDEHCVWFENIKNKETSQLFLYCDQDETPMGCVYFTDISSRNHSAFWGMYATENAPRGTGTKMEYDVLEHAFQILQLHKLNGEFLANNTRVMRLHEKFGFTKEGVFRDFHFNGSEYVDVVRIGMLRNEWFNKRTAIQEKIKAFSRN